MQELLESIADAMNRGELRLLVFSRPTIPDTRKITVRPVTVSGTSCFQVATRRGDQEFHENPEASSLIPLIERELPRFDQVNVYTATADLEFRRRKGRETIRRSAPTHSSVKTSHDNTRQYLIPENEPCPFLVETGVMTATGRVRAAKRKKFRQVNRYLEIVNDLIPHLPADRCLRIVDFGCGRSSLTFALHHLLTRIHNLSVAITGLDLKAGVIADCRRIAEKLECEGLNFQHGDIADYRAEDSVDLCVSLHACDTATDVALARAVSWDSRVILAVPCCHHQLAGQLANDEMAALLRHGELRQRYAALATDTLRARALDMVGYKTQVMEFIETEHTPKNLMIRAVRTGPRPNDAAVRDYRRYRDMLGVADFELEQLLELPS